MTEQNQIEEKPSNSDNHTPRQTWANIGIFFSTLAIIILICAFVYGYFQLSQVNVGLAQTVAHLEQQSMNQKQDIAAVQTSLNQLQQQAQKWQAMSAQQEQFMTELQSVQKGDLNKWHVSEAQYLVKLADDHLQFSHNIKLAMVLLQTADKRLESMQDENVNELRKSIATDIANLQAVPQVNITSLYLHLVALNNQVEQLPLPLDVLNAENSPPSSTVTTNTTTGLPWWKAGLTYSWEALRKIVIVRHTGSNALPLVMPDEKIFIYQNLHAQMEDAMWGVLHRNAAIYQTSLARVAAWITQYFVPNAPQTKNMLMELGELQKENIQPVTLNLSNTLQLFDQYNGH